LNEFIFQLIQKISFAILSQPDLLKDPVVITQTYIKDALKRRGNVFNVSLAIVESLCQL
jgi:hypothetical protein